MTDCAGPRGIVDARRRSTRALPGTVLSKEFPSEERAIPSSTRTVMRTGLSSARCKLAFMVPPRRRAPTKIRELNARQTRSRSINLSAGRGGEPGGNGDRNSVRSFRKSPSFSARNRASFSREVINGSTWSHTIRSELPCRLARRLTRLYESVP